MKHLDVAAIGTCYVDTNANGFSYGANGIPADTEIVGGDYEIVPGGSAVNFCRLLGGLGLNTAFIGVSGNDATGRLLAELLEKESVKPFISQKPDVQTNVSFNMTSVSGEHVLCVAGTANASLSFYAVQSELEQAVADAKILYVGGCFKLKALSADFSKLAAITKQQDALLAIDHGRLPNGTATEVSDKVKALVLAADYYFPSKDEFCALWGIDDIKAGIMRVKTDAPQLNIVLKDGANGAYYYDNGEVQHVPATKLDDVKDVTGAGDAFNAGVMIAVIGGHDIRSAIQYGCDVAAAKISKTVIPTIKM